MEFLKTYTWQNALRGGALRDVYALLYQLEHNAKRKNPLQVSITYIAERLGYSERSVRNVISELKETGWLEVEYTDGRRSVFRTLTPANFAALTPADSAALDHGNICTPAESAPLQDLPPTPAKFAALTHYIKSFDRDIINTTTTTTECARERLKKWVAESDIKQWAEMLIRKSELPLTLDGAETEFYDNDFIVRERCESGERTETLKHFQNWLPKYINKLKYQNSNANTSTNRTGIPPNAAAASRADSASLDDIARSIAAGFAAGAARRE